MAALTNSSSANATTAVKDKSDDLERLADSQEPASRESGERAAASADGEAGRIVYASAEQGRIEGQTRAGA